MRNSGMDTHIRSPSETKKVVLDMKMQEFVKSEKYKLETNKVNKQKNATIDYIHD
jgi:hypothetical protein